MKISQRVIRSLCLFGLWLGLGLQAHAQTDTVTYVYTDPQGTPLVEADASGNVIARYDYTPYGSSVASLGSPPDGPGYTGHVNDPETGLVYMQARYYQSIGRFLSPDPVAPSPDDLFSFNRYAYADNNPSRNIDPDGRETGQAFAAINAWTTQPYYMGDDREDVSAIADALSAVDDALAPLGPDGGAEFHAAVAPVIAGLKDIAIAAKVAEAAKDAGEGAEAAGDATRVASKETGSYTNFHESGKTYSGKGGRARSQVSARRIEKETGDKHTATEWRAASSDREAFKQESGRIDANGGPKSGSNYNKMESPGKKMCRQDGGC